MDKPTELPRDSDQWPAEQRGHSATQPAQAPSASGSAPAEEREGFTLRYGGSKTFAGTDERIGSALGSAPRGSHRLEVVHPGDWSGPREHSGQPPPEDELAARMMQEIEEAVEEIRRQAAGRLISLARPSEPQLQDPSGNPSTFLSQFQLRARRLAAGKPLKAIAGVIAVVLALGVAFRLRRSHR